MTGWFAIPYAALSAVGHQPLACAAVLDLYARARSCDYRPMPWTERELASRWSMDRRDVRLVIEQLTYAGCITVLKAKPGARSASTLTVVPPVNQTPDQSWNQNMNQGTRSPGRSHKVVRAPEVEPDSEPENGPARARGYARASVEKRERRDHTPPPNPRPEGGGQSAAAAVAVAWVKAKALADLHAARDVAKTLARYELGDATLVEVYVQWTKPRARGAPPVWPDAPSGLRRREIVAGLRQAARQWRDSCAE